MSDDAEDAYAQFVIADAQIASHSPHRRSVWYAKEKPVTSQLSEFTQLFNILRKYAPADRTDKVIADDARVLRSLATACSRHLIAECNRPISDTERELQAYRHRQIRDVLRSYPDIVERFSDEPRGYAVSLVCRDGENNSWGGPEYGWGIS